MHKRFASQIPDVITNDKQLQASIEMLPSNYNFEIYKTIWRIKTTNSKCVALQFPEGLLIYACTIADILQSYTGVETVVMGDVTYGACCVDDLTAKALGADLLVHYGHSCLVPIDRTEGINLLYVFVDIQINTQHFLDTVRAQFTEGSKLAFVSTIQFLPSLHQVAADLSQSYKITIPQVKPLSPGEVLGCTSPRLPPGIDAIVYLADGRFHLESIMISNPDVPAYKYDPYDKTFTHEIYDHVKMRENRHNQIKLAAKANKFAVVLGTLGRQGSTKILETIKSSLEQAGKQYVIVLLSELFPEKLKLFTDIEAWVQIACPRLSIDWGLHFHAPVLTPYELSVALELVEWQVMYPMDFYANNSLGPWTVNNEKHRPKPKSRRPKQKKPAATPHATATCATPQATATCATPQATATCATGCGTETSCCSDTY